MTKEKFRRCECGGKIMSDELRRGYNASVNGKQVCADCKVAAIYASFGRSK